MTFSTQRTLYIPVDLGSGLFRVNSASVKIAGTSTVGLVQRYWCDAGWDTVACGQIVNVAFPPYDPLDVYDPADGGPHVMLWPFGFEPLVSDSASAWDCLASGASTLLVRIMPCWMAPCIRCDYLGITPSVISITEAYLTIDFDAIVPTTEESWGRLKGRYR